MLDLIRNETAVADPLRYDYSQVDEAHREQVMEAAVDIKRREHRAAMDIVEIGRSLIDVRDRLPYGQFVPWLETEFGWQKSMAYNFMAVAESFPKFGKVENFGLSALYLLSGPNVPDEAVTEANEVAERGERVTHKAAKAIVDRHRPKPANASSVAVPISRVVGKCRVCGRPLTDPASVGEACGPTCAAKLAAGMSVEPDDDDALQGVAVVGNGPLEDDVPAIKPVLPVYLVALGCRLAVQDGFYFVSYAGHRETYASLEGAVAWCRRMTGTDETETSEVRGTRQERIATLLDLYRQALTSLGDYARLAEDHNGALPARRALETLIGRLEAKVTKGAA